ncbi:MAG: hypothetical protein O7E54_06935 [Planctomycetota bacterium]|nr:hypothetical protein [Planctomycetota bacterium]
MLRNLAGLLVVSIAAGDALMVTRAMKATTIVEVFVTEETLRVELEIGVADLKAFGNLLPDELREKLRLAPRPLEKRLSRFFAQDWIVRAGGRPLAARIREMGGRARVRRDPITGAPFGPEGEPVVFVVLEYDLPGRPKTVSFRPPGASASIGFVAYHDGVAVNDFRYLSGEETLELDWDDPWYSRFKNRNLRRRFDAPMQAFLYVEPYEVRQEIVFRPKDLQHWVDLGLAGRKTIPVADQEEIKKRAAAFLAGRNPVTVDGKPVEMRLDRIHFIRRSLRKTGVIDPPEELAVDSAILGAIFICSTSGLPKEATMTWELFNERIQKLPSMATDEAGGMPSILEPGDAVLRWENFLTNPTIPAMQKVPLPAGGSFPLVSLVCVAVLIPLLVKRRYWIAAGALACGIVAWPGSSWAPPDDAARAVVAGLLHNTYRAFDKRDEVVVYDRLAQSVAGDLLVEVYLQTRRSIELENQGGARVKVDSVELLDCTTSPGDGRGFVSQCTWTVSGSVGHWGHTHRRTSRYRATLRIEPEKGAWKITGLELLEEARLP